MIPQAIKVWHTHAQHVEGLSLITWVGFLLAGGIALLYGVVKKQPAIIVTVSTPCIFYLIIIVEIIMETRSFW